LLKIKIGIYAAQVIMNFEWKNAN